ncbi:hypothetical protein DFQ29_005950 [Apophysomyces sp. BC1021]|nr:hypothetical protein DFQ29_005950 [Apophysomyces sp. BC1021]
MMQAYINAGDFKFTKRIKSAFHVNIRFYLIYVVVGFFGLIYLIAGNGYTRPRIQDFVMAMANSWGLLLVIVFMGYGLVDGPRKLWFSGNVKRRLHQLYAKASRVKEECIDSELEFKDLAKVMNTVSHQTSPRDTNLRGLVDQTVQRFPFVLRPEYSTRDSSTVIPRTVTEEYLVKLNKDMILAVRMKDRRLALWKNLLTEALYLQDVISNRDNTDRRFHSNLRKSKEPTTWTEIQARLEWWWVIHLRSLACRGTAVVFLVASVCILWSELTFNVQKPVISIVALALRACDNNYAAVELLSFFTLMYMCLCVYTSLFKIRFFNLYLLIPNHHTDANSLLWFTGYMCKMMAPLCYNYINLAYNYVHAENQPDGQGQPTMERFSVFSEFMGMADLVPFLGTFTDWFPVVILLPAILVLFNMQGWCLGLCGVKNPEEDDHDGGQDLEGLGGQGRILLDSDVADGKALIAEERNIIERSLHSEIGLQRGFMNRARNALGAYTTKYRRAGSPDSFEDASVHGSRGRSTPLSTTLRQERDRRIEEILSGRTTPNSARSTPSIVSDDGENGPGVKTNLISFGDTVKQKLGGLFGGKGYSSVEGSVSPTKPDEQPLHHQQNGTPGGRRVIGRMANSNPSSVRHMPTTTLTDAIRSRSPSPNPFVKTNPLWMRGDNVTNLANSSVSPFARFEDNDSAR